MVDNTFTRVGRWEFDPKIGDYVFKECGNITVAFPDSKGFVGYVDSRDQIPLDLKGENKPIFEMYKPVERVGVDFGKGIMLDPSNKKKKDPYWSKLPKKGKKSRKNWDQ